MRGLPNVKEGKGKGSSSLELVNYVHVASYLKTAGTETPKSTGPATLGLQQASPQPAQLATARLQFELLKGELLNIPSLNISSLAFGHGEVTRHVRFAGAVQ